MQMPNPISFLLLLCAVFAGCRSTPSSEEGGKPVVAASINPLASLTRGVCGDAADVICLVPPGASPHTYEPTPSQVAEMGLARVLVLVGLGLEFWADDLVSAADNPDLVVVDSSKNVEPIDRNPHVWLDPLNAVLQVELIRDALSKVDPDRAETYRANTASLVDELRALDQEIEKEVQGWSQKSFVAFHPAWVYFARRYGLEQAGVIEETPGHEPSPAEVADIIETVRRIGARAIFAEPQLPPGVAATIAEETGAKIVFLDPLGGTQATNNYLRLIRYNVEAMAEAMK
jgi:zinc transport system substrate-binding protein